MQRLVTIAVAACAAATAAAAGDSCSGLENVRLKGPLGERLDAMIERHVAATDPDYITAPFMEKTERRHWWQTEFWGKWMHSAPPYLRYLSTEQSGISSALAAKVERGVERILASQEPSGYIGNYPDELRCGEGWDVWGMKYTMMGLMHYYDWKGRSKEADRALDAAKRVCDYVVAEIGPGGRRGRELWQTGNWCGYASSSILEPVVWLYRRTAARDGKEAARKYFDFATYIVRGMKEPEAGPRLVDLALKGVSVADRNGYGNTPEKGGSYVMKHNRWKSYEMMSCYQGMLDYAETLSADPGLASGGSCPDPAELVRAAVMTGEDIIREEVNLAGGCACSEAWFHGARKQHLPYVRLQETCVTTTWMRFCERLLEATGDPKWADEIEKTFYNAYLGAMKADGSEFAGYTPLSGSRWHGQHHCYMHTDCCTANGPRGFLCFLRGLFRTKGDSAVFDFYASALVKGELAGGRKVAFDMYSLYPRYPGVRIVSHTEGPLAVKFRIPGWCPSAEMKVNGKALEGVKAGGYFAVKREWRLGDIVEISFHMPVVAHVLDHNVAFTRGPVLLARDSRFADGDMTTPFRNLRRIGIKDGSTMPSFADMRSPSDDIWMTFSATLQIGSNHANPEAALPLTVHFCDYASAGNQWREDCYYRTWFPVEFGPEE
ncbi:MAG: glycoside hydrolase family 127 protein [Kiritimatiellae bacterium]|nr:glycoside hydrolase family 127 protein [Kiritimatiellia bacterium]